MSYPIYPICSICSIYCIYFVYSYSCDSIYTWNSKQIEHRCGDYR